MAAPHCSSFSMTALAPLGLSLDALSTEDHLHLGGVLFARWSETRVTSQVSETNTVVWNTMLMCLVCCSFVYRSYQTPANLPCTCSYQLLVLKTTILRPSSPQFSRAQQGVGSAGLARTIDLVISPQSYVGLLEYVQSRSTSTGVLQQISV